MDENVVEELQFHKQTVQSDDNSPLHLIREKEMEISGRVLGAKREADEIVANARKDAAAILASAHDEASTESGVREATVRADMERQCEQVREQAERDAASLTDIIAARQGDAVRFVVDSVTRI